MRRATELFAERGYAATSLGSIATACGIQKASLFHHHKSKADLYLAVIHDVLGRFAEALTRALTASEGPWLQRLDALTDAVTDELAAQPAVATLLTREFLSVEAQTPFAERGRVGAEAAFDFALAFLDEGVQNHDIPQQDLRQALHSIMGVHFFHFALADLRRRLEDDARREVVRVQIRRLLGAPTTP